MKRTFVTIVLMFFVATLVLTGCNKVIQESNKQDVTTQQTSDKKGIVEESNSSKDDGLGYGFNATGLPITDEVITLEVLYPRQANHGDFEELWFIPWLKDKTNIKLDFSLVEKAGWTEKLALVFAAGDYKEIFLDRIYKSQETTYGTTGQLVDLSEHINDYAPLAVEKYNEYSEIWKEITFPNGEIYIMPCINDSPRDLAGRPIYIRQTWLDNLGLKTPETLDELYDALRAFKERDADLNGDPNNEVPLFTKYSNTFKLQILSAVGFVDYLHDVIDGQYVYVPGHENYRHYLEYMNKLYEEDLLNEDYFSITSEELEAQETSAEIGFVDFNPTKKYIEPEKYEQYVGLGVISSQYESSPMWPANSACNTSWGVFAMTDKCKYPEAAVRMIDYFYTTEGSRAVRCGPEYKVQWDGPGGYEILTETETNCTAKLHMEDFTSYWDYRHAKLTPTRMPFMSNDLVNDIIVGSDIKNSWLTKQMYDSGVLDVRRFAYPNVSFSEEEQIQISMYIDLDSYVETMTAKFITGELEINDDEWNAYIAELKRLGMDEMSQIRQNAYERFESIS